MATWDGHIKLADFGIAKARSSIDPAANSSMMIGKKHYMSPEQILALDVDARSDVFAVGVVLYELLALEPLFAEDNTELAIDEVTVRPIPPIRTLVPNIEPALEQILTSALERDPARRPSAAAMGRALDRWCESQSVVATPDRLQEHLAALFPMSYQPAYEHTTTRPQERNTTFSNLRRGRRWKTSLLGRIFGRV
jgi:serine/threonine-protein kinase